VTRHDHVVEFVDIAGLVRECKKRYPKKQERPSTGMLEYAAECICTERREPGKCADSTAAAEPAAECARGAYGSSYNARIARAAAAIRQEAEAVTQTAEGEEEPAAEPAAGRRRSSRRAAARQTASG
jgi:hypothetical protein